MKSSHFIHAGHEGRQCRLYDEKLAEHQALGHTRCLQMGGSAVCVAMTARDLAKNQTAQMRSPHTPSMSVQIDIEVQDTETKHIGTRPTATIRV